MRVSRLTVRRRAAAILLPALLLAACSAPSDGTLAVTGRVDSAELTVSVPAIASPVVSADAGFDTAPASASASEGTSPVAPSSASTTPTVPQRVAEVRVRTGEHVTAGTVLALLDARALDAAVVAAKADRTVATAQVTLLRESRDDLDDRRVSIDTAKERIDTAIASLTTQRGPTSSRLQQASRQLAALPANPPAAQAAQIGQDRATLQAGIVQLTTALAQIDAGLSQARAERRELDVATAELATARTQLTHLIDLAGVAVGAADVAVRQSELAVSRASVTAPAAGIVTGIAAAGQVLAAGATLATLAQPQTTLTTWLPPADAARVCTGDAARVSADWLADSVPGRIDAIGTSAEYPPTSQASSDSHLVRAVRVTVRIGGDDELPPGGPVDISVDPCTSER
ncbi:HlyD family efflux transporter periplasmic adaptor subunit [Propionicicella superfundia]|uniref:HlyD family efflux transporter periplasmic adaptor subunit n=1 Tax=Propionicicella superfundia TaxID=348582 RepID=UPI00040ACA14|nr:HlyD family efflux transporter periplasmic adaptor subunit [Propionicicella superfundia]